MKIDIVVGGLPEKKNGKRVRGTENETNTEGMGDCLLQEN